MPSSVLRSVVDKGQGLRSGILVLFKHVLPVQKSVDKSFGIIIAFKQLSQQVWVLLIYVWLPILTNEYGQV